MGKVSLSFALILFFSITAAFAQEKAVSPKAKSPVSYGFVIDNSGSARASLEKIVDTVRQIISGNEQADEAFLVRFTNSDGIKLVQEMTEDKKLIQEAVDNLFVEFGLTAIIDAVEFSANYLDENAKKETGRKKILVLITDGEERKSRTKIEDALKLLKEKDIKVFAIGISDEKVVKKVLDKLAGETGGKLFVPKNQVELTAAGKELIEIIRVQ